MSHTIPQLLSVWAHEKQRPVTIFELVATADVPHVVWFGIVEFGLVTIFPNGRVETRRAYVNPGCRLASDVARRTGISEAYLADQPSWAAWASTFHLLAREHIMIGFDCGAFGCVAIEMQNGRYGVEGTTFARCLDARALPYVSGPWHCMPSQLDTKTRALREAWRTVERVEAVAARHGLELLEARLGSYPGEVPVAAKRVLRERAHSVGLDVTAEVA